MSRTSYRFSDNWEGKARCAGEDSSIFEYQDPDSPLTAGLSYADRADLNRSNFEKAEEICIECPVFFQCMESATDEEKRWTVRAGQIPERFTKEMSRFHPIIRNGERFCQRNHLMPPVGHCARCKADRELAYKARQRAKRRDTMKA